MLCLFSVRACAMQALVFPQVEPLVQAPSGLIVGELKDLMVVLLAIGVGSVLLLLPFHCVVAMILGHGGLVTD